jgi:ATP-dependent helicase/nuclease subunit A
VTLVDAGARHQLLHDLDTSFVVEAAAGTGKTTVLIGRIINLVRSGKAQLSAIAAVTFTEKAAGELKLRLREQLEMARQESALNSSSELPQETERLIEALRQLEMTRIQTIHGLCAEILREFPVEALVDPQFQVAKASETAAVLGRVFHRQFQDCIENPPEGIRRILRRRPEGFHGETARAQLRRAFESVVDKRDFAGAWRRDVFHRDESIDSLLSGSLFQFAAIAQSLNQSDKTNFAKAVKAAAQFIDDAAHRESVSARDYDGLEALLARLQKNLSRFVSTKGVRIAGFSEAQLSSLWLRFSQELAEFVTASEADLAACLHAELQPFVKAYETEKTRLGLLDFGDLLSRTKHLLQHNLNVRQRLGERLSHLFVDEFQDTDPLQTEIILLLCATEHHETQAFSTTPAAGKLFVVGDPKQSIYRFRRADIALYHRVKAFLVGHGAQAVELTSSFRSVPGIQAAINGAFELAMKDYPQASYVPLSPVRPRFDSQPSVVALPAPRPFSAYDKVTKGCVEAHLPEAVGAFIHWLVSESGWTVEENQSRVAISARHICILFKRMTSFGDTDVVRPYAGALESRKVPHVVVGGRSFHAREEVAALRTLLKAIEWPHDELSVFAVLRGPFLGFHDEALWVFRSEHQRLNPMLSFEINSESTESRDIAEVLGLLKRLHRERNSRTVAATLNDFLNSTRAHAGIAFWFHGAQALANVLQFGEIAQQVESQASSFRDVLDSLEEKAATSDFSEGALVEAGTEGVRMMTVHQAKGLEFPVVILAEPTANARRLKATHAVRAEQQQWFYELAGCCPVELNELAPEILEREFEESIRLTYVAATRARDLLVVPAVSEEQISDTWTSVLYPSVYPHASSLQSPREAPGCPMFASDCILDRVSSMKDSSVHPGLHLSQTKKNRVAWWSAQNLKLGLEEKGGLELEEALLDDEHARGGHEQYERHLAARSLALTKGLLPRHQVRAAREVELPSDSPIELLDVAPLRKTRVRGARFGSLVHTALAHLALDASAQDIERSVESHARSLHATLDETHAALVSVSAAMQSEVFTLARKALEVRREVAITDVLPSGELVEGVVDMAVRSAEGWLVCEFKTDEDLTESLEAYERAIASATGLATRGMLLKL